MYYLDIYNNSVLTVMRVLVIADCLGCSGQRETISRLHAALWRPARASAASDEKFSEKSHDYELGIPVCGFRRCTKVTSHGYSRIQHEISNYGVPTQSNWLYTMHNVQPLITRANIAFVI